MADRFPLIANSSANQIQEIPSGDQLNLSGNNIANAGVITATTFSGSGASLTNLPSGQLTGALPAIDGSNLTGIAADKIFEGNTEIETVDTGSDGHIKFTTEGGERVRIDSNGRVGLGINNPGDYFSSYNRVVMGRTNDTGGMTIVSAPTSGGYISFADGTSGNAAYRGMISYYHSQDAMVFGTDGGTERLRIDSSGRVLIGRNASRMVGGSTTYAKLQVAGTSQVTSSISVVNNENSTAGAFLFFGKTRGNAVGSSTIVQNGDTLGGLSFIGADGNDTNNRTAEITAVVNGGPGNNEIPTDLTFSTSPTHAGSLVERMRIYSSGRILIGNGASEGGPSGNLDIVGDINGDGGELYLRVSNNNSVDNIGALSFGNNVDRSVVSIKGHTHTANNTGDLTFHTSTTGTMTEKLRIASNGSLTNTTTSTHSQGAGTFNIKGVINQYSQGSGSGLIFDCDFGRLTGYGDDTNVGNGTNLSGVLAHSTTDWTSSNSNTPISVNGGTFQYRVGFGGYFDCISNGGRVSVAAGSGSPNMASKLNTAAMTIEAWVWYDGDGREVIVSRYGSGFPNQFNMLCDPNGQFHYNNGGVGAGGGNVSGEHFPDKTWHHHVWQYESGVNRWYINGAFANSRSAGSSLAVNDSSGFAIFSRADRLEDWRGKIAVVRIYNRALSAAEIKNHFELERGRFGV